MTVHATADEKARAGLTVKLLRAAAGLRQSELATACGIARQWLHNIEAGKKPVGPRLAGVFAAVIAPMIRSTEEDVRRLLSPGKED